MKANYLNSNKNTALNKAGLAFVQNQQLLSQLLLSSVMGDLGDGF